MPVHKTLTKLLGLDTAQQIGMIHVWVKRLSRTIRLDTAGLVGAAQAVADLLEDMGFGRWARYWHYGRSTISLQHRLFVEQVYSDLGEPWSKLVTGFGSIVEGGIVSPRDRPLRDLRRGAGRRRPRGKPPQQYKRKQRRRR